MENTYENIINAKVKKSLTEAQKEFFIDIFKEYKIFSFKNNLI